MIPTPKSKKLNGVLLSTLTTNDDIQQFRAAVAGVLQIKSSEALPAPDNDWRLRWPALAELGVTSLAVPEECGGFGMQIEVAATTAAEFGASLHGSPYAGTVAAAHVLSQAATTDDVVTALLADVVIGTKLCGFGRLADDGVTARNVDGVPGAEALLLHDPATDEFVVLIDQTSWSVDRPSNRFDVTRNAADVTVDTTLGRRVGPSPTAHLLFGLLLAADALGGTSRVLDQTVAYARERIAFGKPIGGFQAVQHRLADHAVRVRGMSLSVRAAARALSSSTGAADASDATRAVVLAEASVSAAASHILHDLLQLTGAIGFTWEYGLHFFQRRVHQDARLGANPRRAMHNLAVLEGWTDVR